MLGELNRYFFKCIDNIVCVKVLWVQFFSLTLVNWFHNTEKKKIIHCVMLLHFHKMGIVNVNKMICYSVMEVTG